MTTISWCLTAGFAGLVVLGFPFAIAIALAITAALLLADIEPAFLAQALISGSQQFSLLAIPLFMLAGELMTAGGLSQRLYHQDLMALVHPYDGESARLKIDWLGVGDYVQVRAQMLARLGYVALAADIYGAELRPTMQEAAGVAKRFYADAALVRARAAAGLAEVMRKSRSSVKTRSFAFSISVR